MISENMTTSETTCNYIMNTNNNVVTGNCDDVVPSEQSRYDGTLFTNHAFSPEGNNLDHQSLSVEETLHIKPLCATNKDLNTINLNQKAENGIMKDNLTSPIDVTVAPYHRTPDHLSNNKKYSQVVLKFLEDDSLELDMVRIMDEEGIEQSTSDEQNFEILTKESDTFSSILKFPENISNLKEHTGMPNSELDSTYLPSVNVDSCNLVWTCAYCSLSFDNQEATKLHQENDCKQIFKNNEPSQNFLANVNQEEKIPTHISDINSWDNHDTNRKSDINISDESFDWNVYWKCVICNKEFNQSQELGHHFQQHSVQDLSSALLKSIMPQYRTQKNIENENNIIHNSTPVKCEKEAKIDNGHSQQKKNIRTHKKEIKQEILDNVAVNKSLDNQSELSTVKELPKLESKSKTIEKQSQNEQSQINLKTQNKKVKNMPGSRDPHTCPICHKILCSRGNLTKHMVLHNTDKPWVCHVCGSGFNTKRDYKHHFIQNHRPVNERPFSCDLCGKKCVSKKDLSVHKNFHKPSTISCDVCGKMFRSSRCVQRHKKRHINSKQHQCHLCFKTFNVKDDVTSHIKRVHAKPKKKNNHIKNKKILVIEQPNEKQGKNVNQKLLVSSQLYTKIKDLSEFLLPMTESSEMIPQQLMQPYDETDHLTTQLPSKDHLVVNKNILTLIPLNQENEEKSCSYGVTLSNDNHTLVSQPIEDTGTYVMIGEAERENNMVSSNLNFMYTSIDPNCLHEKTNDLQELGTTTNLVPVNHQIQENSNGKSTTELHEERSLNYDHHRSIQEVLTLTAAESGSNLPSQHGNFKSKKCLPDATLEDGLAFQLQLQPNTPSSSIFGIK